MPYLRTFGSLLIGALAFSAGAAHAQDRITFYEHGNYGGFSFTVRESESSFGRPGLMNDQASSMRVTGRWLICSDGNYGGRCVEVSRDSGNLGEFRLNDALSSAKYLGPLQPKVTAPATPAVPAVPVPVQREMLQRKIGDAIANEDFPGALKLFSDYRKLPGSPAPRMLVLEAKVALRQGEKKRAAVVLVTYFNQADDTDEDYQQALDLFELANAP